MLFELFELWDLPPTTDCLAPERNIFLQVLSGHTENK